MSYIDKVFAYFDEVLKAKFRIKNRYLRLVITLFLSLFILIIKIFSINLNKLIYYIVFSVIIYHILVYYGFSIPLLCKIFLTLIAFVPFIGEITLCVMEYTNNPYPAMLLRGVRLSSILRECGFPVFIGRNVRIYQSDKVSIGDFVSLHDNVVIFTCAGEVIIGSHTHIDTGSVIRGEGGVYIGNYCAIASGVKIYSISNQAKSKNTKIIDQIIKAPVIIGDDVWIGANAVILPGVRIEQGAVVGAGAVVPMNKVLEGCTIYVGIPAKPLKKRGENIEKV